MKKYIIKSILLGALAFISTSCSDEFTDLKPDGGSTYDNFWKTEDDAIKSVNSIYDYMDDEDMFARGFFWYINASDDMVTGRTKGEADNIKNFNVNGTEGYTYWMYPQSYKIIRRCNDVLFNVPNVEFENETLKNRLLGEAYFMRAFHYFWLAHTYGDDKSGGVPIVTEENMNEPAGSFSRPASVVENYAQLISDLEIAAEKLQYFNEMDPADYGRPHKDAAWGYIAKTYLYWAQYDASKYEKVIEYTQKIINSPSQRALVDTNNPEEDYRRLHSYLENWGSEYIWSVDSGLNGGSKLPGVALENKGWGKYNGWGYYMPTKELYEAFEDSDARRKVTILAWGDKFPYFGEEKVYTSENSKSGYQFNKYMYEFGLKDPVGNYVNTNGNDPTTLYNVPLMRFAEVLLMQAEAKIMTGQSGDMEINLVRDRAGLKPIM
ncbi:MAG: RagB/SusD family nutrient uptake outer membrane protein, partial [Weeksellaceae bacterium]